MPIEIITGQPGNGKSLRMMQRLISESNKTPEQGRRYIVAVGIDGIQPGLADLVLADGKEWNDLDPTAPAVCDCGAGRKLPDGSHEKHGHFIPDGALFFVDEAWKWFGHLHDASRAPTPPHVLMLAEHRHRGFDMIWTTQMANQIYPFVRGLVGGHSHVARKFGTKICTVYTWGELCEDVKSVTQRDKALSETWVHPKAVFDKYKSATVHTIKPRLPWRLMLIPICAIAAMGLGWYSYKAMQPDQFAATLHGEQAGADGVAVAPHASGEGAEKIMPHTAQEWAAYLTPVLPGIAYTAPVFADSLTVESHPQTLCVISGPVGADTCHCYTEQATPVAVADALCREITIHRYYDPFRRQVETKRESVQQTTPLTAQEQAQADALKASKPNA